MREYVMYLGWIFREDIFYLYCSHSLCLTIVFTVRSHFEDNLGIQIDVMWFVWFIYDHSWINFQKNQMPLLSLCPFVVVYFKIQHCCKQKTILYRFQRNCFLCRNLYIHIKSHHNDRSSSMNRICNLYLDF